MEYHFEKLSKLIVVCGGTGGHFYPGLSIAREFKDRGGEVELYLSGLHVNSQSETAATFGIKSVKIRSSRSSKNPIKLALFLINIALGTLKAILCLKKRNPDAVLAMGSFASAPTAIAAIVLRIPLFLHDGNAKVGKANRFFSRWAKLLFAAFPPVNRSDIKSEVLLTGMPIRQELLEYKYDKKKAVEQVNAKFDCAFNESQPTILIFGGSQGAQIFNDIIPLSISKIIDKQIQIIHLTGEGKHDSINSFYSKCSHNVLTLPYSNEMALLLLASDLVICRSGGSTVAELAYFGKYSILIPYPYAAEGHQQNNAEYLSDGQAANIVKNSDFTVEKVELLLKEWLNDLAKYKKMEINSLKLSKPNASIDVLKSIDSKI